MKVFRRLWVPLGAAVILGTPLLSGCGKALRPAAGSADEADYVGSISAREYGFVRPAEDVMSLTLAPRERRQRGGGSPQATDGDLWNRVRAGLQLDLHADSRIDDAAAQLRRDPRFLAKVSRRASPYLYLIVNELEARGLPMELALLPHVESGFNPEATSPQQAAGLWQFMPRTGEVMGLRQDAWYDARRDVVASTSAALDYLERLTRQFDGDWMLAMAAYNCGPGCVANARAANQRAGKPTDYWSLPLPNETRQYVPKILATARLIANPRVHGLELPPIPNQPQLELVRASEPVDLVRVASASGLDLDELKRFNANLRRGRSSPHGPGQVLVPTGTGERLREELGSVQVMPAVGARRPGARSVAAPATAATQAHVVKAGENLATIARRHGVAAEILAELNGIAVRETLLPGQTLLIPREETPRKRRVVELLPGGVS